MDRKWILGGIAIAAGVGLLRLVTSHPKLHADSRGLVIGDSLAQGLNLQLKALAKDDRLAYEGRGLPGSRIDQWATSAWLAQTLDTFQPTLVLISLGTNDGYMSGDVWARQAPSLKKLLDRIEASGAEVVWIGVPELPRTQSGMKLDEGFLDELSDAAPSWFDSAAMDIPRGPDGLHPTARGYAGWAGSLWAWLS